MIFGSSVELCFCSLHTLRFSHCPEQMNEQREAHADSLYNTPSHVPLVKVIVPTAARNAQGDVYKHPMSIYRCQVQDVIC